MKNGTLFIAPLGARNKKEAVFEEIVRLHPDNNFSQALYLVPNAFVLRAVKRHFFSYLKNCGRKTAYIPFHALTIKQLAEHFYETNPPRPPFAKGGNTPPTPLDRGELIPPLEKGDEGGFSDQSSNENDIISERMRTLILCGILKDKNIGYASLLSDLFRKFRHYLPGKDLSQLKEEIRQLIFEEKTRERAVKAIETLQSYEGFLKEKNLVDAEDMLKNCIESINQQSANPSSLPPTPYSLNSTLVIDAFFDPTPLEMEALKGLADSAENVLVLAEEDTELLKYFLSYKEEMEVKHLTCSVRRETSGYYPYPSIEEEVEGLAGNVKKLLLDGVKPWEITLCFPSLSQYLPMLRRIFQKHGLPASFGEYNLSASRPLVALEALLGCIEDDYPRNDFLTVLTSPCYTTISGEAKGLAVSYAYKAGIITGKQPWLSVKDIILGSSRDEDITEDAKKALEAFQKEVVHIIGIIETVKQAKDLTAFADALEAALEQFGFFVYSGNPLSPESGVPERIANIFSGMKQFAELFNRDIETPVFYLRYLLQDMGAIAEDSDAVKVLPYEITAGLETKALFFGGMIEGSFPYKPEIDPILPEKVKKAIGMPHLEYYLERQRHYFKRLLHVSIYEPYISCPSAEGDKVFLPSPFLDWEKAISPPLLNIFTEEDALVNDGEGLLSGVLWKEGAFSGEKEIGLLRQRLNRMSRGYFRVTDLDYYRKCPLRFYIEKVLGLEMEEPPKFEVDYKLWGSLAHKVMERLLRDKDVTRENFEARLFLHLEASLKDFPIGAFWLEVAREIFRKLLPRLKEQERQLREEGFAPYRIEEMIAAEIEGLRLKGKIDRIDKKTGDRGQGTVAGEKGDLGPYSVILFDYKTGTIDKDSLQLPLYAAMWQSKFPEVVESTGYYSLKNGDIELLPKKIGMEEFTGDAIQKTKEIINGMRNGLFPPEPADANECRYCYHSALCEKE